MFTDTQQLHLTCSADEGDSGSISELFGSSLISIEQKSNESIHVSLQSSFFPSLHTSPLQCDYASCKLLPGIDCSAYLSGYNSCILCGTSNCTTFLNTAFSLHTPNASIPFFLDKELTNPFTYLFHGDSRYHGDAPTLFGCHANGRCVWTHVPLDSFPHPREARSPKLSTAPSGSVVPRMKLPTSERCQLG